jgi:hypothetical protein
LGAGRWLIFMGSNKNYLLYIGTHAAADIVELSRLAEKQPHVKIIEFSTIRFFFAVILLENDLQMQYCCPCAK